MGSTWTPAHRTLDPAVPWSAAASPPLHSPLTPFFFCCFFFSFFSFFFFPLSRLLKKWELSEWHSCYYYNYLNSLNFFFKIATWTEESATRLLLFIIMFWERWHVEWDLVGEFWGHVPTDNWLGSLRDLDGPDFRLQQ